MRDILVTVLVFGSLFLILRRPYMGILVWSWLSYMNPHRLSWGFAYNMPFAQIVAITFFAAMFFNKEPIRLRWDPMIFFILFFVVWMIITTFLAIYPDNAQIQLNKVLKIQLMVIFTFVMINTRVRLNQLIWVIVLSIGFFSVKGGVFTIMTAGAFRVWGPPGTFIQENNSLALATLMVVPLMVYLYHINKGNKYLRWLLAASIVLSTVSAIGSQSRGALLAIAAVGFFFWTKSHHKLLSGAMMIFFAFALFNFMPQSWHERMDTISNYEEDASAMGRIHAWKFSINVANDRLTGGGFSSWSKDMYAIYSPEAKTNVVAHSIYFSVLADHGWIGLLLFLLMLFMAWRNLSRVIGSGKGDPVSNDSVYLAKMIQVSLVAYMAGGAFLSLSYFDLPWHMIAMSVILKQIVFMGDAEHVLESSQNALPHRAGVDNE
tara:strand:- start:34944 stop:36242 length:1299 start_codon:yes stop_codon:yes gene_type:complete